MSTEPTEAMTRAGRTAWFSGINETIEQALARVWKAMSEAAEPSTPLYAHPPAEVALAEQVLREALQTVIAEKVRVLREALSEVKRAVEANADDVVWMGDGIETVVDRIDAVLAATALYGKQP